MSSVDNEVAPRNAAREGLGEALRLAVAMLDGRGIAPTPEAGAAFGLPVSHEAICRWRREGRLPFTETRIGDRFYVRASDLAIALLPRGGEVARIGDAVPERRGPGRPRKPVQALPAGNSGEVHCV